MSATPFPILLVLVLGLGSVYPRALDMVRSSPLVTERMKMYKTEALLTRILSEVPDPPLILEPVKIPQNVLNLLQNEETEESVLGEGENLIAYPLNESLSCPNETLCTRYEFELPTDNKPLSSVNLWIPRMTLSTPAKPLVMSVCVSTSADEEDRLCEHMKNTSEAKSQAEWIIHELPQRLFSNADGEVLLCTVEIHETYLQKFGENQKPFLVANMNSEASERKRRSTVSTSNKNCTCCLVDFYVSFKEIGWHWVVAPSGFYANMCSGKCSNQINTYPSHYHQMLAIILNNKTLTEKKEDTWTPCCSPTKLSPLNMIYVAANSTSTNTNVYTNTSVVYSLIHHKIPNMITESCGCW